MPCPHGLPPSRCKECCGYEHGRLRTQCKECATAAASTASTGGNAASARNARRLQHLLGQSVLRSYGLDAGQWTLAVFYCFDFILEWDGMSGMEVGFDSLIFCRTLIV